MKVATIRLRNYKSYADTGEVPVGARCTVLVGQNSAGKTAFIECLTQNWQHKPHRVPIRGLFPAVVNPHSQKQVQITLSGMELLHRLLTAGGNLYIPVPVPDQTGAKTFLNSLFEAAEVRFLLGHTAQGAWTSPVMPSHQLFELDENSRGATFAVAPDHQSWSISGFAGSTDGLPGPLGGMFAASTYVFRAERMNISEATITASPELLPDASNLPSVLLHLPSNPAAHESYIGLVREVFPSVYSVASKPISADRARISIVMNDPSGEKASPGINVELNDSGTGISQVLAMLYVAVMSAESRLIVIDEPNSFLHPGAAKKLLTILRRFDHQYIVATHSSDLIRTLDPEYVHLIAWQGTEAVFRTLDRASIDHQRQLLGELGVRLSDVFGADGVLWVEGPTEERCFPLLLQHQDLFSAATAIVSVVATADLESKRPRAALVWDLYERLNNGTALVPPALAFSFDREGRSEKEIEDMTRRSHGTVRFLPRRTYENYLLDADAISAVLGSEMQAGAKPSSNDVAVWLEGQIRSERYKDQTLVAGASAERWPYIVNAPAVLSDLFAELSGATVEYRKTLHSVALTTWLLSYKPVHLKELLAYTAAFIAKAPPTTIEVVPTAG